MVYILLPFKKRAKRIPLLSEILLLGVVDKV